MTELLATQVAVADRPAAAAPRPAAVDDAAEPAAQRLPPTLSCVIPCRNEADNLARLRPWLADTLATCSRAWVVILVDDGSTDTTPLLLAGWARRPGFRVLQLSRNFGKEAALTAGLQAAAGDVVVMMDADLQHPPALIPGSVAHWRAGADVVYAIRQHRHGESAFKRLGTRGFYALLNAADRFEVPAGAGDFRLMDCAVVDALLSLEAAGPAVRPRHQRLDRHRGERHAAGRHPAHLAGHRG